MDAAIERLVFQIRKEVYRDLEKGKEIMPKGWFFVNGKLGPTEIIIPGVEKFFTSGQMKDLLTRYVAQKWGEYRGKGNYDLLAVVIMSDQYVVQRSTEGMSTEEAIAMHGKVLPRNEKDRMDCISFMIFMPDAKKGYMFRYVREKRRVKWVDPMEDIELADFGRFKDMYPKHLQTNSHG